MFCLNNCYNKILKHEVNILMYVMLPRLYEDVMLKIENGSNKRNLKQNCLDYIFLFL